MRKFAAVLLSFVVVYGLTLIPAAEAPIRKPKSITYSGINYGALEALKAEVANNGSRAMIAKNLNNLIEQKSVVYQSHVRAQPQPTTSFIWIYLAGLIVGVAGFASNPKQSSVEKSKLDSLNPALHVSSNVLSNVSNAQDVEKILENSSLLKDFKGMNQLVAENTIKMNYLFKLSSKVMDIDFDENLSECFIETGRLNDVINDFMMANYQLIKNDKQVSSVYYRTSEKGQRFNLNCFIPSIQKDAFALSEVSNIFIQKLSTLESKFNLYYPRVSFRWITSGEIHGVDICLSLENKSELESTLKESTT